MDEKKQSKIPEHIQREMIKFFMKTSIPRIIAEREAEQENERKAEEETKSEPSQMEAGKSSSEHTRLYVERRERQLHQKDVAKVLGIHPSTYQAKEKGKKDFSLREAKMLAKFYDMSLDELFGND